MKSGSTGSLLFWMVVAAVIVALGLAITMFFRFESLAGGMDEVKQELSLVKGENQKLSAELEGLRDEYEEIIRTAEAVETLLSSTNKEFSESLRQGLRRNEQMIREKENSLSTIQARLEELQQNDQAIRESHQETVQELRSDLTAVRDQLEGKTQELKELSGSLDNLATLHAKLKNNLERVSADLQPEKGIERRLEDEHIQLMELQSNLKKKSDSFQREMTRMEGYIKEIRLELNRLAALKSSD